MTDTAIVHGLGMPHKVYPEIYDQIDAKWLFAK